MRLQLRNTQLILKGGNKRVKKYTAHFEGVKNTQEKLSHPFVTKQKKWRHVSCHLIIEVKEAIVTVDVVERSETSDRTVYIH